jgi:hypothetical protein
MASALDSIPHGRSLYSGGTGSDYLTDDEVTMTLQASSVMSAFSLCGSIFIVLCYFGLPHLRKFAFKLVMILSLTDVANQAFDFVTPSPADLDEMERNKTTTTECLVQAIGNSIFELSSVLWTTAIAATLYMFIFKRMQAEQVEKTLPIMFAVCFGIPLFLGLLPLSNGAYGPSGAWCWIRTAEGYDYWQFIIFYGPLWLAVAFNTFVYVRTWRLLRQTLRTSANAATDETYKRFRAVMSRLQMYPFILIAVWLFASINRVYEAATGGKQVFALYFLQRFFSSSQGIMNALAYGLSGGVREALREKLAKCFPGLFKDPSLQAAGIDTMGGLGVGRAGAGGGGAGGGGGGGGAGGQGEGQAVSWARPRRRSSLARPLAASAAASSPARTRCAAEAVTT